MVFPMGCIFIHEAPRCALFFGGIGHGNIYGDGGIRE